MLRKTSHNMGGLSFSLDLNKFLSFSHNNEKRRTTGMGLMIKSDRADRDNGKEDYGQGICAIRSQDRKI